MIKTKTITLRDVARLAGVSVSTVSRYINNSGYVERKTAERISDCIRQIDYHPSRVAQSLKLRRSNTILLVVPDICNPFYSIISKMAQKLLIPRDYALVLYDSEEGEFDHSAITLARQMYASGILFGSIDIKPDIIQSLVKTHIPIVALNAYEQYPFDTVHVDGSEGSFIATQHLITLGHKRIGFAGGTPGTVIGNSRREGYERALEKANLKPREEDIIEQGFTQLDGVSIGQRFAAASSRPTAICCANDLIALGLISALNAQGITVPDEVSVVGMDDIPYAQVSNPGLTTVTNDGGQFALEGMRMLFDRIDGKYSGAPRRVTVHHQLVERHSTTKPQYSVAC